MKYCPIRGCFGKKFANKSVRNYRKFIPNGKIYRKIYEQYDIHDYIYLYTKEDYEEYIEKINKENASPYWYKGHIRK